MCEGYEGSCNLRIVDNRILFQVREFLFATHQWQDRFWMYLPALPGVCKIVDLDRNIFQVVQNMSV